MHHILAKPPIRRLIKSSYTSSRSPSRSIVTSPGSPHRKSKAVLSALQTLQNRISTLTEENATLSAKLKAQNSLSPELSELRLKYQQEEARIQNLEKGTQDLHLLRRAKESRDAILENKMEYLERENSKLRKEVDQIEKEYSEFKKRSEKGIESVAEEIRLYGESGLDLEEQSVDVEELAERIESLERSLRQLHRAHKRHVARGRKKRRNPAAPRKKRPDPTPCTVVALRKKPKNARRLWLAPGKSKKSFHTSAGLKAQKKKKKKRKKRKKLQSRLKESLGIWSPEAQEKYELPEYLRARL